MAHISIVRMAWHGMAQSLAGAPGSHDSTDCYRQPRQKGARASTTGRVFWAKFFEARCRPITAIRTRKADTILEEWTPALKYNLLRRSMQDTPAGASVDAVSVTREPARGR